MCGEDREERNSQVTDVHNLQTRSQVMGRAEAHVLEASLYHLPQRSASQLVSDLDPPQFLPRTGWPRAIGVQAGQRAAVTTPAVVPRVLIPAGAVARVEGAQGVPESQMAEAVRRLERARARPAQLM